MGHLAETKHCQGDVCTTLTLPQRWKQMVRWVPPLQKPLCSGPACPNLPLGPLKGPNKKSASLLGMSPSNTIIPQPVGQPVHRLSQGVYKQHSSCQGSAGCPRVHQLLASELVGLALPCPFLPLCSASDLLPPRIRLPPSPYPFIYRTCPCRGRGGGLPLKFKKRPPFVPLPIPTCLLSAPRSWQGEKGE